MEPSECTPQKCLTYRTQSWFVSLAKLWELLQNKPCRTASHIAGCFHGQPMGTVRTYPTDVPHISNTALACFPNHPKGIPSEQTLQNCLTKSHIAGGFHGQPMGTVRTYPTEVPHTSNTELVCFPNQPMGTPSEQTLQNCLTYSWLFPWPTNGNHQNLRHRTASHIIHRVGLFPRPTDWNRQNLPYRPVFNSYYTQSRLLSMTNLRQFLQNVPYRIALHIILRAGTSGQSTGIFRTYTTGFNWSTVPIFKRN